MRQKADKLEKGKWYFDSDQSTLLKYSHSSKGFDLYTDQRLLKCYSITHGKYIGFRSYCMDRYIPTQEDRDKYNLVDDE